MVSGNPGFGERCANAVKDLARIHNNLAKQDLHSAERRQLERELQKAKTHFQCLLRLGKQMSE